MKHIQRGLVSSGELSGNNVTIPLSGFTNVDKMFVVLDGYTHANNTSVFRNMWVKSLSVDSLVVGTTATDNINGSYQVVEFD